MSFYRQQLEEWLANLQVKAHTVFDIGGEQGNVKDRVKRWQVVNYKVWDLPEIDLDEYHDEWFWDEASIERYGMPSWSDEKFDTLLAEKADIVFCLEVFEYLTNPIQALENIRDMLKSGGKAYITFAFCYPHHNELQFDSLRYTEPGINRLAKHADLKINKVWYRRDRSGILESFYKMDGMRTAKQYPNHDVTGFIVEFEKYP